MGNIIFGKIFSLKLPGPGGQEGHIKSHPPDYQTHGRDQRLQDIPVKGGEPDIGDTPDTGERSYFFSKVVIEIINKGAIGGAQDRQ